MSKNSLMNKKSVEVTDSKSDMYFKDPVVDNIQSRYTTITLSSIQMTLNFIYRSFNRSIIAKGHLCNPLLEVFLSQCLNIKHKHLTTNICKIILAVFFKTIILCGNF